MKCRIMRHFIWVFTASESTRLGGSRIQKVKTGIAVDVGTSLLTLYSLGNFFCFNFFQNYTF